jgi:hypothetical protein
MQKHSRRTILTQAALAVPLGVGAAALAGTSLGAAPKGGSTASVLVSGIGTNTVTNTAGTFVGTLTVNSVQVINGILSAVATVNGNLVDQAGNVIGTLVNQIVNIPLAASGSCEILSLTLGPLHLNLLGLVIDLNQVVLNITAVPGAGNLLGNLLCAVAHLLDAGGPLATLLQGLASLLNQILAQL